MVRVREVSMAAIIIMITATRPGTIFFRIPAVR